MFGAKHLRKKIDFGIQFIVNRKLTNFIAGNATTKDTLKFVQESNIPLYHKYEKCSLYINPIIHGPPNINYYNNTNEVNTNDLIELVIQRNRSNCVYVYSHIHMHDEEDKFYSVNSLGAVFKTKPSDKAIHTVEPSQNPNLSQNDELSPVSRGMIVTVGDIGFVPNVEEIMGKYPGIGLNSSNYEKLEHLYLLCIWIQLLKRVDQARQSTKLDVIDMVTVKITEEIFFNIDIFDSCISLLNSLCQSNSHSFGSTPVWKQFKAKLNLNNIVSAGLLGELESLLMKLDNKIQFYGLYFYNIKPYCCYTPPGTIDDIAALFPVMVETELKTIGTDNQSMMAQLMQARQLKYSHCDFIGYNISPAHASPATYPMLDGDAGCELEEGLDSDPEFSESLTKNQQIRAAMSLEDHFAASSSRPGDGDSNFKINKNSANLMQEPELELDERMVSESNRTYTRASIDPLLCYPGTGSNPCLETAPESPRHSSAKVESELDQHRSVADILHSTEQGNRNDGSEYDKLDDILKRAQAIIKQKGSMSSEEEQTLYREFQNCLPKNIDEISQGDVGMVAPSLNSSEKDESNFERVVFDELANDHVPTILLSNLYPEEIEAPINETLNYLCPALRNTVVPNRNGYNYNTLQQKAMRVVYSIGVDVLVMDAYTSAALGKVDYIVVNDLLTPYDTQNVFGQFGVPKMN